MNFHIVITDTKLVDEFPQYWTNTNYRELLEAFEYEDAQEVADDELREMLFLAMTDLEPAASAKIVLDYKLKNALSEGQRDQISHEMLLDKISEEYADINLHYQLFHINQLLFKAYNGKFPSAKASVIDFELKAAKKTNISFDKALVLRALSASISNRSVLKRLFEEQLNGKKDFPEAEAILWELERTEENQYRIITSEYWLDQSDFETAEFDATIHIED